MATASAQRQQDAIESMRSVLGGNYCSLHVSEFRVDENLREERCTVVATIHEVSDRDGGSIDASEEEVGKTFSVEGGGVGMIDAFFAALKSRYVSEYPSLASIRFTRFSVTGLMAETASRAATDAVARATVGVTNSYDTEFTFVAETGSVSRSSMQALLLAVQYFVNSERAYVQAYRSLEHARAGGRHDLVTKYTQVLSEVVRNTSYSEVIERLAHGRE